jgi:hypothetical protein
MDCIDDTIRRLPPQPEALQIKRIGSIYSDFLLDVCKEGDAKSLSWLAAQPTPHPGTIICSTDVFQGTEAVWKAKRASVVWCPDISFDRTARLVFSPEHIYSTTQREELSQKGMIAHVSRLKQVHEPDLVLEPLVMGAPWIEGIDEALSERLMYARYDFYEQFIEDVDEFSAVNNVPTEIDWSPMERISERAFKICITQLLGDMPAKDWGGERSDHFSAYLHLQGRRTTAAFLFKGPARFRPMTAAHLGKNGDQIDRLASEPAALLVLQHCHDIMPPVRGQLRAYAVQPSKPRRYLIIDGRDSFRLLKAYNLVKQALRLSDSQSR